MSTSCSYLERCVMGPGVLLPREEREVEERKHGDRDVAAPGQCHKRPSSTLILFQFALRLPGSRLVCWNTTYEFFVKCVGLHIQRAEVEVSLAPVADLLDVSCDVAKSGPSCVPRPALFSSAETAPSAAYRRPRPAYPNPCCSRLHPWAAGLALRSSSGIQH